MKVEVLGPGCPKCQTTFERALTALKLEGIEGDVVKVDRIDEISRRGVFLTPALVVDGVVMMSGKVPSVDEIRSCLTSKP